MSRPRLSVVPAAPEGSRAVGAARWVPLAIVLAAALAAGLASPGRRDPGADPEQRLRAALEERPVPDPDDPVLRDIARSMRGALGRNPLDSRMRVLYGALLGSLATDAVGRDAAVFHVQAAASLAPVTVPVVRRAVLLEVELGQTARAAERIRDVFDFDPDAAADLLLRVEPLLGPDRVAAVIAGRPRASVSWARALRRAGRGDEADAVLFAAIDVWPDDPGLLENVGNLEIAADRRDDLVARFADRELVPTPDHARLFLLRGRARAWNEREEDAADDLGIAERLAEDDPATLFAVGDAWLAIGRPDDARRAWSRARYRVEPRSALRVAALRRLATLADDAGTAAESVRAWRRVLDEAPEDPVATRRLRELTGAPP